MSKFTETGLRYSERIAIKIAMKASMAASSEDESDHLKPEEPKLATATKTIVKKKPAYKPK